MSQPDEIRKIQTQGVHHITLVGADRQTSIDFWEGVLGMPFIFDQPNLDNPDEGTDGVDLVPHTARKREVKAALNNSFGFGGTNASVIVKAVD